jgi:hypothetical protein
VKREPLNLRLRAEAAEWSDGEPARALLLEAAEALELIVAEVARRIEEQRRGDG